MTRLLSDVDGRIKHVLTSSVGRFDEHRIRGLLRAFPPDVEVTIAYSFIQQEELASQIFVTDARAFHRSSLERIVAQTCPDRAVNLVELHFSPHTWVQDLFHAYEGRQIMPSLPRGPSEFFSDLSDFASKLQLSSSDIQEVSDILGTTFETLQNPFWVQKGFSVLPNNGYDIFAGGDVLVNGETVLIGEWHARSAFEDQLQVLGLSAKQLSKNSLAKVYAPLKESSLKSFRSYYDDTRKLVFVDHMVSDHLDMFFTPLPGNAVAVGDVYMALKLLRLPANIRIASQYQHLAKALRDLADQLAKKGRSVVPVPALPSLYDADMPVRVTRSAVGEKVSGQTMRVSWNNVLQERSQAASGEQVNRIYVPEYPPPGEVPLPAGMEAVAGKGLTRIDPERFAELQQTAMETYRRHGLDVVPVPFFSFYGHDGGLRCSVKVLERN